MAAIEVKTKEGLDGVDALIIPGGESTTMAFIAEKEGLMEPLRAFVESASPAWGTCAGMIFLANNAEGKHLVFANVFKKNCKGWDLLCIGLYAGLNVTCYGIPISLLAAGTLQTC